MERTIVDQRTYVMIKPDAVARGLVGRIVARFEDVGLRVERLEYGMVTEKQAAANYASSTTSPVGPS
jgi:nucleoside-diphosphate kinase